MDLKSRLAVGVLAAWLVLLSGFAYPQLAAHSSQHAHHNAATHASALCSWLCAAGQGIESYSVPFESKLLFLDMVPSTLFDEAQNPLLLYAFFRGPPAISL